MKNCSKRYSVGPSATVRSPAGQIKTDGAGFDGLARGCRRRTAQDRLYASKQLARAERLRDVIVRPPFQAGHLVLLLGARSQEDDREILRLLVALDRAGQFQTALVGQHPVNEEQVWSRVGDLGAGFLAVFGFPDQVAGATKAKRNHVAYGLFVFDDQDVLARHVLPECGCAIIATLHAPIMTAP
jgi:hypothetical protein